MQFLSSFLKKRPWWLSARVVVAFGAAGALGTLTGETMPPRDIRGVADALGVAAHGTVAPSDVRWEPSSGAVADLAFGRWVLFLASDGAGAPRDVWRARVRVTPEGAPLQVAETYNLTQTPLGDDHALVARGTHAAFATFAYGQEQSVTLLDLEGEAAAAGAKDPSFSERITGWLTNVQQTGSRDGIGRVDITLDQPALAVGLALGEDALAVDLADGAGRRHAQLDYARGELTSGAVSPRATAEPAGMHAEATRHLPKRFVLWAVDTVRAVPWIGPAPIAWLEEKVFAAKDEANQLAWKLHGADSTDTLADVSAAPAPPPPRPIDASQAGMDLANWPPPTVPSMWKTAEPGEGEWRDPKISWMKKGPDGAPPAFLRTFVRPDEERPYAQVLLVAMDMRQLDFDMEAGTEDPKPLTGGHGPGRIPRDPRVITHVAAAFNGAFKTEHGNYGMMVHKRVLLPPQPNAASVVVLRDNRVGFGTWGNTSEVTGLAGIPDGDIASFRQNLDPLLDQGKVNPNGRALWGYTLPGSGMQTQRSGLCVTGGGQLVYAWGDDVSATVLAKAMKMAGCVYGMHLDMNPHHTGFIFAAIDEIKGHKYRSELLTPLMDVSPDRYIEYAPKDFFYVMQRDPSPPALDSVDGQDTPEPPRPSSKAAPAAPPIAWRADPGAQPAPIWSPAVWSAEVSGTGGAANPPIEVLDVEPGRTTWRIRAGMQEPDAKTGALPAWELGDEDAHRVILAVGVGASPDRRPRGLATDGRMVLPIRALKEASPGDTLPASAGALVAQADGTLSIVRVSELASISPHEDVAEVPLLLDAGALVEETTRATGTLADRGALGMTKSGRILIARGRVNGDGALAEALRRAGCVRAVALDRGLREPSFVHRAGTPTPPRARYDVTTLYAIASPMKPRAFRFEAVPALAPGAGEK